MHAQTNFISCSFPNECTISRWTGSVRNKGAGIIRPFRPDVGTARGGRWESKGAHGGHGRPNDCVCRARAAAAAFLLRPTWYVRTSLVHANLFLFFFWNCALPDDAWMPARRLRRASRDHVTVSTQRRSVVIGLAPMPMFGSVGGRARWGACRPPARMWLSIGCSFVRSRSTDGCASTSGISRASSGYNWTCPEHYAFADRGI